MRGRPEPYVTFANANSRPTYFSVHRIAEAQRIATGRGVKVGIIDHYFGFDANRSLYADGVDFLGDEESFRRIGEHGLWLTRTLKEIAPDAEVYALNATSTDEAKKTAAMVKAIQWAAEHHLSAITYSNRAFSPQYRKQIDAAVEAATAAGVNCVFIHYTHPANLLPFPMASTKSEPSYDREPDVNVYHYDYNVLMLRGNEKAPPFLSLSSTSVVTAGVLAMMREIDGTLTPADYKRVLMETAKPYEAKKGTGPEVLGSCPRVIDAEAALNSLKLSANRRADVQP
jgi:hypothetical protein